MTILMPLIAMLGLSFAGSAFADDAGFTRCNVRDGKATGYFCIRGGSTSKSGRADIHVFDEDGDEIASDWTIAIAIVIDECEEIVSLAVDDDAAFCTVEF